ncbi:hypothetical protein [Vibrio ziniensis]|uniref:Uncharacterized protein n=1 Tax=Vibrio ziniensis TaxID=2711221 RepID=A0A6G7CLP1_9VIBR|nr:hypothetical protein [Vibrio ziniensis]QIH43025.1 hypothetical protein G5S32_14195 [Vibrio ziniensis]
MKYFKWFNILCFFILIIYVIYPIDRKASPVDGFFKRNEIIITKGEDRVALDTNADFMAADKKYTSIITVTDVDKKNQFSTFSIDGDIYSKNGLIISKTNKVEETVQINKQVIFTASSSPLVSQIQKSFLGIDIYRERRYQHIFINDFFCYYDVDKHIARCME